MADYSEFWRWRMNHGYPNARALARACGFDSSAISYWDHGRTYPPRPDARAKLLALLASDGFEMTEKQLERLVTTPAHVKKEVTS